MAVTAEIARRALAARAVMAVEQAYQRQAPHLPTGEVNRQAISQHAPGVKLDDDKPDVLHLVMAYFPAALEEVAKVSAAGAEKYTEGGWRTVANGVRRYSAAGVRHLLKIARGKKFDDDPHPAFQRLKVRHRAEVAWNALAALELELAEEAD